MAENFIPLHLDKIDRFNAQEDDLRFSGGSVRLRESRSFKPEHIKEPHGGDVIDFPIDAGTNLILETPAGIPGLVLAVFEYEGIPTVHMIQRAKRKSRDKQEFVIGSKELEEYRRQGLTLVSELAKRKGKSSFQVVSGWRNVWAHDPDGDIPLSVLITTYDKGMKELGFHKIGLDGREIAGQSSDEIDRLMKKIINGDKNLTWGTINATLGNFYFWRKSV